MSKSQTEHTRTTVDGQEQEGQGRDLGHKNTEQHNEHGHGVVPMPTLCQHGQAWPSNAGEVRDSESCLATGRRRVNGHRHANTATQADKRTFGGTSHDLTASADMNGRGRWGKGRKASGWGGGSRGGVALTLLGDV